MEISEEASLLGWVPKEQFRGDPDKWVEAEEFVERGKHILPILRKNNEKLLGEITILKGQVGTLSDAMKEATESMEALKVFHKESTEAQVAKARREILDRLKAAKTEQDVDAEVEVQAELSEFDAAGKVATKPAPKVESAPEPLAPEVKAWMAENPWYGVDQERTGLAMGIANRLKAENTLLKGSAFLAEVKRVLEERWGALEDGSGASASKVEGGGGRGGSSRSGGKDYASLPADARARCDADAKKFVGANKVYKTTKEWNAFFASQYFGE